MSFISILKKIGAEINQVDQAIPIFGPILHAFTMLIPNPSVQAAIATGTTKVQDGLDLAVRIVTDAEAMGQAISAAGPQKAAMTAPALAQLFLDLPILQSKKPKDPVLFKTHAAALGGAIADLLNDFEG